MNPRKKNNTGDENDEVEELLRAAQDAALLKLTLNSHTVHASSSDLHPDLEQRFRSLKTGSKSKAKPETVAKKIAPLEPSKAKDENEAEDDDDLLVRFAALKASIPKPPTSVENVPGGNLAGTDVVEEDEEDEVEKVIRWAMDAARLDPSPADDDDDDEDSKSDDYGDSEKSDEDSDSPSGNRKGQPKYILPPNQSLLRIGLDKGRLRKLRPNLIKGKQVHIFSMKYSTDVGASTHCMRLHQRWAAPTTEEKELHIWAEKESCYKL